MTKEEIEKKAEELSQTHKRKVHPLLFEHEGEQIIGYIKEPDRLVKMRAIDMLMQSATTACDILIRTSLIEEESDKRILSEAPEHDSIYLGAILASMDLVKFYQNQLKKK